MKQGLFYIMSRLFFLLLFLTLSCTGKRDAGTETAPLEPAGVEISGNTIALTYAGDTIFTGHIESSSGTLRINRITDIKNSVIHQVISFTSATNEPVRIKGVVNGSGQSFPCEADRPPRQKNLVRHSVGLSHNLRNHAVYDRHKDWLLSVDYPARTRVIPLSSGGVANRFEITSTGYQIGLRFRPRYYQQHRGLEFFEPWTYEVWQPSVAGWCSWFAYFNEVTEQNIRDVADVLQETLVPYGLSYLQIDDGYQQEPAGLPSTWNIPNDKFPSGLGVLAEYIRSRGMVPGIWTYTSFHQKEFAESHPEYFVRDADGNPAYGRWVGYVLDGSSPATLDSIIRPIYRGLREKGWGYFKVDALRHLRYEGYNSYADYFIGRNLDRVNIYRDVVRTIRMEIGEESFMLGCWGARPELTGIIDGCRIGGDGYGYACLTQFNSFNNVVWRNDPDHIELSEEEGYRSCMVTTLTGSLYMLTDKAEIYRTPAIEPARRTLPVLFTLPGQVYDVDPSRTMELGRVDAELSGDAQRVFDGNLESPYNLYSLEINKPWESWMLLGRTEEHEKTISFSDLGLDKNKEYLVFEFWTKQFCGIFRDVFIPPPVNRIFNCQLFCIREKKDHPQLLATSRHISCGGTELKDLEWNQNTLSGRSQLVPNDPYIIYIHEPEGYRPGEVCCSDAVVKGMRHSGNIRSITLLSPSATEARWRIQY